MLLLLMMTKMEQEEEEEAGEEKEMAEGNLQCQRGFSHLPVLSLSTMLGKLDREAWGVR